MAQPKNGVSAQDVKKIARLSRLHVEADRLQPIAEDLNGILGWIEQLGEVDVEGCLLYTSPSPRDATLSRMPSSA